MGTTSLRRSRVSALLIVLPLTLTACVGVGPGGSPTPTPSSTSDAAGSSSASTECASPNEANPYDPVPTTAGASTGSDWVGITQRVDGSMDAAGSSKGKPKETTILSASGDQSGSVKIPVSTSKVVVKDKKRSDGTALPTPKDGVATVDLTQDGIADLEFQSQYEKALPIDVSVSYTFNGKPVSSKDIDKQIKGKNGTVEIRYVVKNTTSAPITTCFTGFDGTAQRQTVTTPLPLIAYVSATVPESATSFTAPGATPTPAKSGVALSWTQALFAPLGATSETFDLTMTSPQSEIPKMHITLATLDPTTLTGQAAATSTKVLGTAQAAASQAIASVQSALEALQQRSGTFGSSRSTNSSQHGMGPLTLAPFSQSGVSLPGFSLPGISEPKVTPPTLQLQNAPAFQAPRLTVPALTDPGLPGTDFAGLQSRLTALLAQLDTQPIQTKLDALSASIGSTTATAQTLSQSATALATLATTLDSAAAKVSAAAADLNSKLPPALTTAIKIRSQLDQIQQDVNALNHPADSALQKLNSDLQAERDQADALVTALTALVDLAKGVAADAAALKNKADDLLSKANSLATAATNDLLSQLAAVQVAEKTAADAITAQLASEKDAADALGTKLAAEAAQSATNAKDLTSRMNAAVQSAAGSAVQDAETKAAAAVSNAQAAATDSLNSAKATVNRVVDQAKAATAAAVSQASAQASQAIKDAQASAQTSAASTQSAVQDGVTKANNAFAQLLALNQQALTNQLPEGSATGATEQNGRFHFSIDGT